MKKILSLLLAAVLVLACAACGTDPAPEDTGTQPSDPAVSVTVPQVEVDNPVTYFQLSIGDDAGNFTSLTAYDDGMGMACVEYVGDIKKVATMDPAVLHAITAELEEAGLKALNGRNAEGEGGTYASMYITFADESFLGANWSGTVDQDFLDAYEKMDAWFAALMADVPEYVPQPVVMGEVDAGIQAEMLAVLESSGLEPLDMFYITADVYAAGVSAAEGVTAVADCGPMMSTTAYSFTIAAVEDAGYIENVRKVFENNLDWNRWVCVSASNALIAQKDNMVVCVMGGDQLYTLTARAIEDAGWTEIETFKK